MLLASLLRDSNETKKAIKRSLAVMFPHDPTYVDRVSKQDFSVPSASTISRFRLAIDVSYARAISMYILNLLNETRPFAIYFLCDSSPRGGRDWLLSEYWLVSGPNIEKVVELQNEIIALRKLLAGGSEEDSGTSTVNVAPCIDSSCFRRWLPRRAPNICCTSSCASRRSRLLGTRTIVLQVRSRHDHRFRR